MRADEQDAGLPTDFMPPVTGRPGLRITAPIAQPDRLAPPFTAGPPAAPIAEPETSPPVEPEATVFESWEPPAAAAEADFFEPWSQAQVSETDAAAEVAADSLSETAPAWDADETADDDTEFPLDAFMMPEVEEPAADHVITEDAAPEALTDERSPEFAMAEEFVSPSAHQPLPHRLADKLENVSRDLRTEESAAVISRLAQGDKLDALLAGLLAGFLAGSGE